MKRVYSLFLATLLFTFFSACSKAESASTKEVVSGFFSAFENSDYETMKQYCTEECVNTYFHADDVDGMKWAKATAIEDAYNKDTMKDDMYAFRVNVEMEASQASTLYGAKKTSFYILMEQDAEGSWKINSFVTGL